MPQIQPFAGWRYDPGKADPALVTLPSRHRLSPEAQAELYRLNDRNAVRLVCGRVFPSDAQHNDCYSRAASHLDAWRAEGLFLQDKPAIYVYQHDFIYNGAPRARRGFFARVLISDENGVMPCSRALPERTEDRLRLRRAARADLEPVFGLLTDPSGDISSSLYNMCQYEPAADFTDSDGTRHRLWVFDDPEQAPAFCAGCGRESIFIADGHARYAAARAYRDEVRAAMEKAGQTPPEPGGLAEDFVMMFIVPDGDPGMTLLPVHRLLRGVSGLELLPKRLQENFTLEKTSGMEALEKRLAAHPAPAFGLSSKNGLYAVCLKDQAVFDRRTNDAPTLRGSAAAALQRLILQDLLNIDESKSAREENVVYTPNTAAAIDAVKSGKEGVQCAFLLRTPAPAVFRTAARAGVKLPAQSAHFFPDPRAGMVFNFFW